MEGKGHLPHVVFLCHESAEKYLKALIIHKHKSPPKIHDLESLINMAKLQPTESSMLQNQAIILDALYSLARYPGEETITSKNAKDTLKAATKIQNFLIQHFSYSEL